MERFPKGCGKGTRYNVKSSNTPPACNTSILFNRSPALFGSTAQTLARPHSKLVLFAVMEQSPPSRILLICINSPGLPRTTELHNSGHREFTLTALTVCHHWIQKHGPKRSYCLGVQYDLLLISDVSVLRKPLREQKMVPLPPHPTQPSSSH